MTSPQAVCLQNQSVVEDKARGILISGSSLVLQRVSRDQAGAYSCAASNLEGDAVSNTVHIQIRCESGNFEIDHRRKTVTTAFQDQPTRVV